MDNIVETFDHAGFHVTIAYEDSPSNPRDWIAGDPCASRMICMHRRYNLGDKHEYTPEDFDSWAAFEAHLYGEGAEVLLPLELHDHSGLSMKVGRTRGWDHGQVGIIYLTREAILARFGGDQLTDALRARAVDSLMAEVATYSQFLEGDVYMVGVGTVEEPWQESLGDVYGLDEAREEGRRMAEDMAAALVPRLAEEALAVQNACNLTAVLGAAHRAALALTRSGRGTDEVREHPVMTLYADKIAHLTGTQNGSSVDLSRAYDACEKLAAGE